MSYLILLLILSIVHVKFCSLNLSRIYFYFLIYYYSISISICLLGPKPKSRPNLGPNQAQPTSAGPTDLPPKPTSGLLRRKPNSLACPADPPAYFPLLMLAFHPSMAWLSRHARATGKRLGPKALLRTSRQNHPAPNRFSTRTPMPGALLAPAVSASPTAPHLLQLSRRFSSPSTNPPAWPYSARFHSVATYATTASSFPTHLQLLLPPQTSAKNTQQHHPLLHHPINANFRLASSSHMQAHPANCCLPHLPPTALARHSCCFLHAHATCAL